MSRQVASLHGVLSLKDESFKQSLRDAKTGMGDVGGRLQSFGGQVAGLGAKISLMTAPLAAFGIASIRTATNFEYSFADVRKTVSATDEELIGLRATIREMSTSSDNPLSSLEGAHDTLAQIMAAGGQLGIATQDLVQFTETIGALSVATNLTAEDGATQLAQLSNIVKMSADDFDNFAGALVRLGNNSATTEADIMAMTSRVASAGDRAGFSVTQTLAYSAALASMGISAELGGSNFSKFIGTLTTGVARGGRELDTLARVAGMKTGDFKRAFETDAAGAVQVFLEGLNKLSAADKMQVLEDLGLTGQEVERVVLSLAGNTNLLTESLGHANDGWIAANDHMNEAAAKADTTQGGMNRLQNQLTDLGVQVGDTLMPAFNDLLETISPIILSITDWIAKNPELALTIGGITAALVVLGPALMGVGAALGVLGGAVAFITSPIGALVAAVVALGLLIAATWEDYIKPALEALYNWFVNDAMPAIVSFIETTVMPVIDGFVNILKGIWESIQPGLQAVYDWFVANGLPVIQGAIDAVIGVVNLFIDGLKLIWNSVEPGLNALKNGLETVFGWINNNIVKPLTDAFAGLFNWVKDLLTQLGLVQTEATNTQKIASDAISANNAGIEYMGVTAPGKAAGGPVEKGSPYTVGEFGPELFIPASNGTIVPNEAMGGTTIQMGQIVIYANSRAEGEAAADAFGKRLTMLLNEAG